MISVGKVSMKPSMYINDVMLIDNLKHNLLKISQLCALVENITSNKCRSFSKDLCNMLQ